VNYNKLLDSLTCEQMMQMKQMNIFFLINIFFEANEYLLIAMYVALTYWMFELFRGLI
jgi:hypothetical protein